MKRRLTAWIAAIAAIAFRSSVVDLLPGTLTVAAT